MHVCVSVMSVCVHMVTGSLVGGSMLEVNPVEPIQHTYFTYTNFTCNRNEILNVCSVRTTHFAVRSRACSSRVNLHNKVAMHTGILQVPT